MICVRRVSIISLINSIGFATNHLLLMTLECGILNIFLRGQSHLWFDAHVASLGSGGLELAYVGCRVTSKTLGIGVCERQWGDVKETITSKRGCMLSDSLEKQSILYGANCIKEEKMRKDNQDDDYYWGPNDLDDTKLNKELAAYLDDVSPSFVNCKPVETKIPNNVVCRTNIRMQRYVKAYLEEWETKSCHVNDLEHHYRLLHKYQGLCYIWPSDSSTDNPSYACNICSDSLMWCRKPTSKQVEKEGVSKHWGWSVILLPKGWDYI